MRYFQKMKSGDLQKVSGERYLLLSDHKAEQLKLQDLLQNSNYTHVFFLNLGQQNPRSSSGEQKYYSFSPNSWIETLGALEEVHQFVLEKSESFAGRAILTIDDWQSLKQLRNSCPKIFTIDTEELLKQLKNLSLSIDILLVSSQAANELRNWPTAELILSQIQDPLQTPTIAQPNPEHTLPRAEQLFRESLQKLRSALSRSDLLNLRRDIQASSDQLSSLDRERLSDAYREQLAKIKALESSLVCLDPSA